MHERVTLAFSMTETDAHHVSIRFSISVTCGDDSLSQTLSRKLALDLTMSESPEGRGLIFGNGAMAWF